MRMLAWRALHTCLVRRAASTIGRAWINSDTGNKDGMICFEYASSVSMSHLQQQQQQQLAFCASLSASGCCRI